MKQTQHICITEWKPLTMNKLVDMDDLVDNANKWNEMDVKKRLENVLNHVHDLKLSSLSLVKRA